MDLLPKYDYPENKTHVFLNKIDAFFWSILFVNSKKTLGMVSKFNCKNKNSLKYVMRTLQKLAQY